MIEEGLVAYLATKGAVVGLVGDRVYPELAPESDDLKLVYTLASDEGAKQLSGAAGYSVARVQLECLARGDREGYRDVKRLADRLRQALDGYAGAMGSYTVRCCWVEDYADEGEAAEFARQRGTARLVVNVRLWYLQDAPTF